MTQADYDSEHDQAFSSYVSDVDDSSHDVAASLEFATEDKARVRLPRSSQQGRQRSVASGANISGKFNLGDHVLIVARSHRGEHGVIKSSGHGFYAVDVHGREVMKRGFELELYNNSSELSPVASASAHSPRPRSLSESYGPSQPVSPRGQRFASPRAQSVTPIYYRAKNSDPLYQFNDPEAEKYAAYMLVEMKRSHGAAPYPAPWQTETAAPPLPPMLTPPMHHGRATGAPKFTPSDGNSMEDV